MSKKVKNIAEASVEELMPKSITVEGEEVKLETKKSYLKQADKIVRRMDRVLTDLYTLQCEASDLSDGANTTEVSEKDMDRFTEIHGVLLATTQTLYFLTQRMARKYVGKEIESFQDGRDRKSLKK